MKQGKLIRRAVSAVLAGCMMFTLLPVVAFAALGTLTIGNSSFDTETNINEQELGGGTISYDAETHTLTLNGVNIEDFSHDWVIDFNDMDTLLNLVLVGKTSLRVRAALVHLSSRFPATVRCRSQRQTLTALPVLARVKRTSRLDLMLTSLPWKAARSFSMEASALKMALP